MSDDALRTELAAERDFADRMAAELARHGWGDMHYGDQPQDRNVVRLLAEHKTRRRIGGGYRFVDDRHALYVGWVLGLAMRNGVSARPIVDDAGNYTDRLVVDLEPGVTITLVVPPSPDDWTFTDDSAFTDGRHDDCTAAHNCGEHAEWPTGG